MQPQRTIAPDAAIRADRILLPSSVANSDWPQAGGSADHVLQNVQFGASPTLVWRADIGKGIAHDRPWLPPPIVAEGKLFTVDSENQLRAFDAANGQRLWSVDLTEDVDDDDALSGGIAYADGRVIATTGFGQVIALQATTGKVMWRRKIGRADACSTGGGRRARLCDHRRKRALCSRRDRRARRVATAPGDLRNRPPARQCCAGGSRRRASSLPSPRVIWSRFVSTTAGCCGPTRSPRADVLDEVTSIAQIRGLPLIDRGRVFATSQAGIVRRHRSAHRSADVGPRHRQPQHAVAGRPLCVPDLEHRRSRLSLRRQWPRLLGDPASPFKEKRKRAERSSGPGRCSPVTGYRRRRQRPRPHPLALRWPHSHPPAA